jgi:hypothetical protein
MLNFSYIIIQFKLISGLSHLYHRNRGNHARRRAILVKCCGNQPCVVSAAGNSKSKTTAVRINNFFFLI